MFKCFIKPYNHFHAKWSLICHCFHFSLCLSFLRSWVIWWRDDLTFRKNVPVIIGLIFAHIFSVLLHSRVFRQNNNLWIYYQTNSSWWTFHSCVWPDSGNWHFPQQCLFFLSSWSSIQHKERTYTLFCGL